MSLVEGTREPYSVIRARLRNPPNAVPDRGIDLRRHLREPEPEPVVEVKPDPLPCSVAKTDKPFSLSYAYTFEPTGLLDGPPPLSIRQIQRAVCMHFGMPRVELMARRRFMKIVRARQITMYLCRLLTSNSYPEIGRRFGGMDHSSVIHGIRKIEAALPNDQALRADVLALVTKLAPERSNDIPG